MKKKLKKVYQLILRSFATRYLERNKPDIIAITGSIGKTSSKDAIYEVLAPMFRTRKNIGNANEEIGAPFTIIGGKNVKNIFALFYRTFFSKNYPQILVLEMGADRFGDLKYLTSFIKPKVAVITRVACSHLEYFCDLEGVAKEKGTLVEALGGDGWAVLNYDDPRVREMDKRTKAKIIFYGTEKGSDVVASQIQTTKDGISFVVNYKKEKEQINLKVFGRHNVYSALSAICCGIIFGVKFDQIKKNLENYKLPENRTAVLSGPKNTMIISDVYNANPESMIAAFEMVDDFQYSEKIKRRRVFILGDMLELGDQSEKLHLALGSELKNGADLVLFVGEKMKKVFDEYKKDFSNNAFWFENSERCAKEVKDLIKENDIILVKGSHGMRMDVIVKAITKPNI